MVQASILSLLGSEQAPCWYSNIHSPYCPPLCIPSDYFQIPIWSWLSPCLNPSMTCHFPFLGKIRTHILNTVYSSLYYLTLTTSSASSSSTLHFPLRSSHIGFPLLFFPKSSMLSLLPRGLCTCSFSFLDCASPSLHPSVLSLDLTFPYEFFLILQSRSGHLGISPQDTLLLFFIVLVSVCNYTRGYVVSWPISISPIRLPSSRAGLTSIFDHRCLPST